MTVYRFIEGSKQVLPAEIQSERALLSGFGGRRKIMKELEELERSVATLSKSIADFPIGAISINDLKPPEERIRDTRDSLRALSAKMLMLRASAETQKSSDRPEESQQDTYDELREKIAHWKINNIAVESCLQNSATQKILQDSRDNEISETLRNIMRKLFTLNDVIMGLEESRAQDSATEMELKRQLRESLSEFRDFLKHQEGIRRKKLRETNPEIAQQKESIHRRLQKINIMKRLITNLAAASTDMVKENPALEEMWKKHRELLNIETVQEMAKETNIEDS